MWGERPTDRQALHSSLWHNVWVRARALSPMAAITTAGQAGSGRERQEAQRRGSPLSGELWVAAAVAGSRSEQNSKRRGGSGDGLLFEPCPLWFQSVAIYIPAISMWAEAGCCRFHHHIHYIETLLHQKNKPAVSWALLSYFVFRISLRLSFWHWMEWFTFNKRQWCIFIQFDAILLKLLRPGITPHLERATQVFIMVKR